jgi:hypothetical protein
MSPSPSSLQKKIKKPEKSAKSKIGIFDLPREVRDQVFHEVRKLTPTLTTKYSSAKPPAPPAVTGKSSVDTVQDDNPDIMNATPDRLSIVITQNEQPTIPGQHGQHGQPTVTDTTSNDSSTVTKATKLNNSSAVPETSALPQLKLTIHYNGGCACAQGLPIWLKTSRQSLKEGIEQLYRKSTWTWEPQYKAEFTTQHEK